MLLIILTLVSIYIIGYCITYGRMVIKDGNKLGGIAIFCFVPFIIAAPIFFYMMG